jgi:hypothetical protein
MKSLIVLAIVSLAAAASANQGFLGRRLPAPDSRKTVPQLAEEKSFPDLVYCANGPQTFQFGIMYALKEGKISVTDSTFVAKLRWQEDQKVTGEEVLFDFASCKFESNNPVNLACAVEFEGIKGKLSAKMSEVAPVVYLITLNATDKESGKPVLEKSFSFLLSECRVQ